MTEADGSSFLLDPSWKKISAKRPCKQLAEKVAHSSRAAAGRQGAVAEAIRLRAGEMAFLIAGVFLRPHGLR